MTRDAPLPAAVLDRKAVVYVRQSCQTQVETNLESRRRQYELVEVARRRGFRSVEVIDDDLGRSASGMVARAWLRASGGVALRRRSRRGALLRRLPARAQWPRLAPPARALRAGRGAGDRSRWRLRPLPTQRPAAARDEGQHQRVRARGAARRMLDAARAKAQR